MKKQSYRLLIVLGWMLAGCAPTQRVANVYENPAMAGKAYAKVLVVGATENTDRRRHFEDDVVRSFAAIDVGAVSSLATIGGNQAINREVVAAAARDTGSDAVLITRLLDEQVRAEVEEGRSTAASAERRNDVALADFFRYDYVEHPDPMTVTTIRTVLVASDLYDVATETRVWSAQSTTIDKESVDSAITGVAEAVTRSLRSGGWLD